MYNFYDLEVMLYKLMEPCNGGKEMAMGSTVQQ